MPQPLNRVVPDGAFLADSDALKNKPELAILVAGIFAHWAAIEQWLGLLLVRILGADAEPAIAMFSTLTAQHLQMGALEAAARAALTPYEYEVFEAVIEITDSVQTPRNHLAHWIWGKCPKLLDAICLAEPQSNKERDRQLNLLLLNSDRGMGVNLLEMTRLGGIDPSTVTVYRQGDLERANRDLEEAEEIAYGLTIYLDGIFTGRRNLGMRAGLKEAAVKERERLFQQLYERRLFREVWDRKHMGHTQPQSPPGSPAIAPDS